MSIRYIDSNDLINDVPDYLQNIINNMDCVYIDGIKPNNQHFNLAEHDKQIRADVIDEIEEKLNNTGAEIIFNLPVEEILGEDIDLDDFAMLVQDAVQVYRKMVLGVLKQLKEQKNESNRD